MADILKSLNIEPVVLVLILVAVVCIVVGCILFLKLMSWGKAAEEKKQSLVDEDYIDNFKDCFTNAGSIEGALEQLAEIYTSNKFMYKLITDALDYINNDYGDYETALEMINVEKDERIRKLHEYAVEKATGTEADSEKPKENPGSEKPAENKKPAEDETESHPEEDYDDIFDDTSVDVPDVHEDVEPDEVFEEPDIQNIPKAPELDVKDTLTDTDDFDFGIDFDKDEEDSDMDDYKI